jgi:hypothetical protein
MRLARRGSRVSVKIDEREREGGKGTSPSTRSFGDGVLRRRCVCEERRGAGEAKGVRQGLDHEFYRGEKGEGRGSGGHYPLMAVEGHGGCGFMAFKGPTKN